jgi:hypothetical protein
MNNTYLKPDEQIYLKEYLRRIELNDKELCIRIAEQETDTPNQ